MPMKPHCDRCDVIVENFCTWAEDDIHGVWHIKVSKSMHESMLCPSCLAIILRKFADQIDPASKTYDPFVLPLEPSIPVTITVEEGKIPADSDQDIPF